MTKDKGESAMEWEDPKIKIRAPLRCDGIGRLDCAEDIERGVRMAIRWLPLEANGDAAVRAVSELPSHPTLPRIQKTGRLGASAFVAMDFPEGRLLSTVLGEPMRAEDLCRIGSDIADALATIHAQNVFHGEMSADSLLLLPGEKAILWDMPLVIANRLTDRRGEERAMSQLPRMAPFLSPERAQGRGASAESDVYALGAVMCLAGGGKAPPGGSTLDTVYQIASGRWCPDVPAGYSAPVRGMLKLMVHSNPAMRPSAREVAEALAQIHRVPTVPEMPAVVLPAAAVAAPSPVAAPVAAAVPPPLEPALARAPSKREVPAVAASPAVETGMVEARPVSHDDITAALVEAAGASAPLHRVPTIPELPAVAPPPPIHRRPVVWLGAAICALVLILGSTALYLALKPVKAPARPAVAAQAQPKGATAAAPADAEDEALDDGSELLEPLPAARKPAKIVKLKPVTAAQAKAPEGSDPNDFSFLESEKPAGELKRPEF